MKLATLIIAVISLLISCSSADTKEHWEIIEPDFTAYLFDSLTPLFPDSTGSAGKSSLNTDVFLKGSTASVLYLQTFEIDLQPTLSIQFPEKISIETFELIPIPVHENTGYFGMTERQLGFHNSHVVRNAPFEIYEVLKPVENLTFSGNSAYAFYLKADTKDVPPGDYAVEITVSDDTGTTAETLTWTIRVHNVELPEGDGKELYYTNWFVGPRTGFEKRLDEDWWRVMDEHLEFMREGGQNVALVPRSVAFDISDNEWALNKERLDRFMTLCESHGFQLFEGPRPGGRKNGFLKKGIIVGPGRLDTFTVEATDWIKETYTPLYNFLEERESLDVWVQHILDEPMGKHAEDYQWVAEQMREAMPGVCTIDATKTRKGLVGAVDIWSPLVSEYQKHHKFYTERQEAGDEVWIYSCMVPGGKWLNRTMDQERLRSIYVGWGAAKFGITGFLRWDLDRWRDNQDIWAGELSGSDDALVRRPFGDGFVVYPDGEGGFLSTTRWEAGRVGMEDYRLLMMLKEKDLDRFKEIIAMCFTDFKTYESNPAIYREARRALLEALSSPDSN